MNDLISRQAAIDALADKLDPPHQVDGSEFEKGTVAQWGKDWNVVMRTLDKLPSAQPEPLVNESRTLVNDLVNDTISRQAAIDAVEFGITYAKAINKSTGEVKELFKEGNKALNEAVERIKDLPSAQPDLIAKIQNGIKVTDADDVYSCGMRNGMRWCKSLIDDEEPLYENCPSAQPESCDECKHLGKWENEVEYGYPSPCTHCKRRARDHYER